MYIPLDPLVANILSKTLEKGKFNMMRECPGLIENLSHIALNPFPLSIYCLSAWSLRRYDTLV